MKFRDYMTASDVMTIRDVTTLISSIKYTSFLQILTVHTDSIPVNATFGTVFYSLDDVTVVSDAMAVSDVIIHTSPKT